MEGLASEFNQALQILRNALQSPFGYAVATSDADHAMRDLQEAKRSDAAFENLSFRKMSPNEVWITHAKTTK